MKRRATLWLLTAALLAALLAGCQSGGGQRTEGASDAEQGGVPVEESAPDSGENAGETAAVITATKQEKARTVITTDGEVDDQDSVIRALLYANDMDIAGIALTSSMYHYAGDAERGDDAKQEGIIKEAVEHIGFYSAFFGGGSQVGAMQSQRVFLENVERDARLFRGKSGKILGKHYVQHPAHTFNFPMFPLFSIRPVRISPRT